MGVSHRRRYSEGDRKYEVEWTTISYRTIAFYAFLVLLGVGFVLYLISPKYFGQKMRSALETVSAGLVKTGAMESEGKREAHFVNIDGTVRVRKAQSAQWVRADYNTNLEKGDYIQTGGEGVARIIFADGTNYVLKPDSLIVVEESREDRETKATHVAVNVSAGAVDLFTGRREVPGSTLKVKAEDAVADVAQETSMMVRNDPERNVHEFRVQEGRADVTRGSTTVGLGQYEQATFSSVEPGLTRSRVIAPPTLVSPDNMGLTVTPDPQKTELDFSWKPVPGAEAYRLQVSSSGMLSNPVVDQKVLRKTSAKISGLEEGTYWWAVASIDAKGVESPLSRANRFTLVQRVESGDQAFLEVTNIIQHGRLLEVVGRTEPGSLVIINNEQVFTIKPDGTFSHFTSQPATKGQNQITITAQNRKGDIHTIRKSIVVE